MKLIIVRWRQITEDRSRKKYSCFKSVYLLKISRSSSSFFLQFDSLQVDQKEFDIQNDFFCDVTSRRLKA